MDKDLNDIELTTSQKSKLFTLLNDRLNLISDLNVKITYKFDAMQNICGALLEKGDKMRVEVLDIIVKCFNVYLLCSADYDDPYYVQYESIYSHFFKLD